LLGILKRDGSKDHPTDSPRSILKENQSTESLIPSSSVSTACSTNLSHSTVLSLAPINSNMGALNNRFNLKGVLKKDSSQDDNKDLKSILKLTQSEFVRHSSDSSSGELIS